MSHLMQHSDVSAMDDRFVELFDEIVTSTVLVEGTTISQGFNHAELERKIESGLEELEGMRSTGWRFNQRRYTSMVMHRLGEASLEEDSDMSSIFLPYCHFMTMIGAADECSQLQMRFKQLGWLEVVNLSVNRHAFREFAEGFAANAELLFESNPDGFDVPTAKTVSSVASLFNIALSPHLNGHINFITCDSVDQYAANHWEPPSENTRLQ